MVTITQEKLALEKSRYQVSATGEKLRSPKEMVTITRGKQALEKNMLEDMGEAPLPSSARGFFPRSKVYWYEYSRKIPDVVHRMFCQYM